MLRLISELIDEDKRFLWLAYHGFYNNLSDEEFLKRKFKARLGYTLNLDNPKTYNEKIQWLKIHDRRPIYNTMVDKYEVKKYVASIIGEEYIIPTIGVWDKYEDIEFDTLPDQFVLKCTHDSGGLVIVPDKHKLDLKIAKRKITKCLKNNYYFVGREWPYKDIKPRIIAEKYLTEESKNTSYGETSPLKDYKIYTFNGVARLCMINQDRKVHTRADYFDRNYKWLDFKWGYDHAEVPPPKPRNYELMYELAEKLAVDSTELRVDFYEVNGRVFFGELTFFDGSGFDRIEPIEWDYKLGSMIKLPDNIKE